MDPTPVLVTVPSVDTAPALNNALGVVIDFIPVFVEFLKNSIGYLIGLSFVLSALFLLIIIYCVERLKTIRRKEEEIFETPTVPVMETTTGADTGHAKRWERVKQHVASENPNDWRQAIIEADIILDELLSKIGYRGETVGEKLKRAHKGDFVTLDDAWAGHMVRNRIAHEGSHFEMNKVEAQEAVAHYRKVFEEFYYI